MCESTLMPMTHMTKNRNRFSGTGFWCVWLWHAISYWIFLLYQLPVTTCSIFVPVYGTSFLVRVFGADFWYVYHGHKSDVRHRALRRPCSLGPSFLTASTTIRSLYTMPASVLYACVCLCELLSVWCLDNKCCMRPVTTSEHSHIHNVK